MMVAEVSGVGGSNGPSEIQPQKYKQNYMSEDLAQMKSAVMEEVQYLVLDHNQLLGMVKSCAPFIEYGDEHFANAYQALETHVSNYCDMKNDDPAAKLTSIAKNQLAEAGQSFNNVSIKLQPDQFAHGVHKMLTTILHRLEKEQHTPRLWSELTGTISNLCNLPTFSSDQAMNEIFFDLSTYTLDSSQVPENHLKDGINAILKAL